MPARYNDQRHHSADSFRNSGTFDHLCSDRAEDSDGSLPGHLNPLSSHDNIHHARSGSTDSLDTPSIGSHSRQSSGSIDSMNTVASTASGPAPFRKTSSTVSPANPSHNPMQFVQHGRSNLSMEAAAKQRQIDQVKEIKKKQQYEGEDWQDNLSSWRSKRLTKSSSYHRSNLDEDEDEGGRPVKTYKDIVEERKGRRASLCFYPTDDDNEVDFNSIRKQRRASLSHHPGFQASDGSSLLGQQRKGRKTSLNFYPIEDTDDFPTVSPSRSEIKTTSESEEDENRSPAYVPPKPGQRKTSLIQEPIGEEEIAPWAIEEPDYGPDLPIVKNLKTPRRFHLENMPLTHIEKIDENGTSSVNGEKSPKLDIISESDPKNLKKLPKVEPSKDNKKLDDKKPGSKKPDNHKTEPIQFGKGMLKPTPKKEPAGKIPGKDQLKPVNKDKKPAWATKDLKSASKGQKSDSKDIPEAKNSKDIKNSKASKDIKPEAKDSKPDDSISNGKKKTDEKPATRKPGRRTAPAAMPSRRHGTVAPPPTNPHLLLDQLDIPAKHKQDFRKAESSSSDESSESDSEEAKDKMSSRTTGLFNSRNNLGGRRRKISAPVPPVASELNFTRERRSSIGERPDPYFLHPNRHWKADDIDVTITQEPNNPSGFGITIKGGKDQLCPIIVDKIAPGSAASKCNVCEGDEIVYVNDTCAEDQFRGSVMLVINQANKKGHLEMKLRRYENKIKTRVKLSDTGYKRHSLSFEASRALPGVGTGEYDHGIRRKSTGSEQLIGRRQLVDIPITESEEQNEPVTTPPVGIVAQRRSSLQSAVIKKPFEVKDISPDLGDDDDDDLFEELIKPEEAQVEEAAPKPRPEKPPELEFRKPLLSNRFTKMPSIADAQEKLRQDKASVDTDDYDSEDERLEQEIMDRLEAEAEEEERQTHEMESIHNSILSSEGNHLLKQTSPVIQAVEKRRENNCDEQNNVPKYRSCSATSDSDSTSLPGTPRKSSVTLKMNLKPSVSKQDSFDSPPAQKDPLKNLRRRDSSESEDRKPVFKSSGSFEAKPVVHDDDDTKSSFVKDNNIHDVVKPSVEPVSYSEPPKFSYEEPPKPAIPLETKPAPIPSSKPPKISPRTSSPRRPQKNYAFMQKFASEDTTDSKTENYKSPSYLDKYVKEIDQEKEFDNLFNFDTKVDDDSGQKTYTVYDHYMDHSPRSDLSLTSKPKPYGGYIETAKPKPYTGFTSESSLPSSATSSTADLSLKVEPQNSLYLPKPRPFVPLHNQPDSGIDKSGQDVNKTDYTRPGADDDSAEKFDQDKKVPPLDISFGNGKDEDKLWEKLEKPTQKKLPWEKLEFRKFGSLDSLKKDSPRSNNSLLESGAETPPWRAESPARQEREREESTARWAEAACHTKPQFESPSKLLDSTEQPRYDAYTDPAPMFYESKNGSVKSSTTPSRDSDSLPSDYSNGDTNKKTNKHCNSSKLEEEKRKRVDWRREQERKNQELFAKSQWLREGNSLEEVNPQDIERNDHMHQAIHNTELRKLQDLKNGSIPEWAQTDRAETDEIDHEMEEKARQEAEEWERYRKEKERNRLERDGLEKQRQKDEERRRIAQEAQKRHLEEKQRQQQMEEERKQKKAMERERQHQQEEADRIKREQEMAEWQRQQELELERLHEDRERDKRRWEEQQRLENLQRQRPDTLPVQQRHQIQVSVKSGNYSQPPQPEGRVYDPAYLDGHIMSPDKYYGQAPPNGRSPRTPDARVPEKGHPQGKVVTPKGEFLSASPLIGRRDVRSPKTHKKGPISAHPITKDDIRDRSIPQPKRRDTSSPLVHAKIPIGHNQGPPPGSPQFLRRDDAMNINRKSLGRSGDFTPEDSPVVHVTPELMSKERLKNVGAAPRAQTREDWVQPKHKNTTSEPKDASRGFWLIEEAERRRQAEMNERELHGAPRISQQGQPYQGQGYSPNQGHPRLMDDRTGGSPFYQAPGDRSQSMPRDLNNSRTMPDMRQPGDPLQKSHQPNNSDYYEPQSMTKSQSFPQFGQGPPQDYHDGGYPGYQAKHSQHHPSAKQERPHSYAPSPQARPAGPAPAKPPRGAPLPGGANTAEPVISVSGKHRCSHCSKELGQGAAMVIESLQLYYHTQCFRCCVCHTRLGTGQAGADVRVRGSRLHCQNCYSNDEGMKYSRV